MSHRDREAKEQKDLPSIYYSPPYFILSSEYNDAGPFDRLNGRNMNKNARKTRYLYHIGHIAE